MKRELRLGVNRDRPRLWLEGKILSDHGFVRGDPFVLTVTQHQITIQAGIGASIQLAPHSSRRRVSGKTKNGGDHPIIDVVGEILEPFADRDLLLVATPGSIVIRPAK